MAAKLDKEEVAALVSLLALPWGHVKLECDGYKVDLQVRRVKGGMTYRVLTFVNSEFQYAWVFPKAGEPLPPETKFLRKSVVKNISSAKRLKLEKALGKRRVAKDPYYSGSMTRYMPDWPTGRAVINHLVKVCDSIKVLTGEPFAENDGSLKLINVTDESHATASF